MSGRIKSQQSTRLASLKEIQRDAGVVEALGGIREVDTSSVIDIEVINKFERLTVHRIGNRRNLTTCIHVQQAFDGVCNE